MLERMKHKTLSVIRRNICDNYHDGEVDESSLDSLLLLRRICDVVEIRFVWFFQHSEPPVMFGSGSISHPLLF